MSYIYLAGPYTGTKQEMLDREAALSKAAAELINDGHVVYSPITHGHSIATRHELPREFAFWERHTISMLRHAESLTVLKLKGWEKSVGVAKEIELADLLNIPIVYLVP